MGKIRRLVLDTLKPHDPTIIEVASRLSDLEGISAGSALVTLFGLGLFLGHTSQENILFYGVKTVIAGIVSIAISLLLGE